MTKNLLLLLSLSAGLSANAQWTTQASGFASPARGIIDIVAVNANVVWAVAFDGSGSGTDVQEFTRTTNGGTTWTPGMITGAPATYNSSNISAVSQDSAWVAMYDGTNGGGGIFMTANGGGTWTQQTSATFTAPNGFPNVVHFWNGLQGFAMGDPNGGYFEIYTTSNSGNLWTRVPQASIPAHLGGEYGYTNLYTVVGNTVWFGTNKGRIYKSTDQGLTWTVSTTGFTDMSDLVMKDANNGLCRFNAQLKSTSDGGVTWTNVTPTGLLELDLDIVPGTNTYFCTGAAPGGSGSAYSNNGGVTWVNVDTIQHLFVSFVNGTTGWSGGFNIDNVTDGVHKWNGVNLDVNNLGGTSSSLNVYPNPASGTVYVQMDQAEGDPVNITLVDMLGKTVAAYSFDNGAGFFMRSMDVSSLAKGIYLVNVQNGLNYFQQKIVVQ